MGHGVPGGPFTWASGNGSDALTLGPGFYNVNFLFGTGTNHLTLDPGTVLTGIVRGQGGANTFDQNGATLLPPLSFIDFP